ncbi:5-oxoprolinase subunit B family protein [Gilvibacter sediminis]|uniref:5-oxoprolinase subunit B family protein n=1 Tax=Gilvibacter sediminis TaxID=379071 RepID=UPI00235101D2|nr:allophanate hydrolase subunit 1 [Gilvibacter sediminis]MDC7998106.1 allophanate hydrolase subunit 1 [Gilvibacter sediminis]
MSDIRIRPFGKHTLLIEWPAVISPDIHAELLAYRKLVKLFSDQIAETVISYNAIALHLKPAQSPSALKKQLEETLSLNEVIALKPTVCWELPVCYNSKLALDLDSFLESKQISLEALIDLHSGVDYHIYFCGFLPGFIYLGGLNSALHQARLAVPRTRVPAGSVGIAGSQTGIYPQESPGGWNLIGRCPVPIFNPLNSQRPSPFNAGQLLRFVAVSYKEYLDIEKQVASGIYQLTKKEIQ